MADKTDQLIEAATEVRLRAYAPYSKFLVGAAILADDGEVYVGCNVENAAYPEGTCAEAGAIAAMIASGAKRIEQAVVVADAEGLVSPCGGCRQKLAEFSSSETPITLAKANGDERAHFTMQSLLPESFSLE